MNNFKHALHARWTNVVKSGLSFIMLTLVMALSPAINPLQNAQAATATISEDLPSGGVPADVLADWKAQDGSDYAAAIADIKTKYPSIADKITGTGADGYSQACHLRRVARMKPYAESIQNVMFARHGNFDGFLVGYHDNSDPSNSAFHAGGALCLLNFKNYYPASTDLLAKTDVVIRDPCISFDGKKVLFAISGKGAGKGYKIYEMDISNLASPGTPKQITVDEPGLSDNAFTVADFEPCYLPNGDIMFTSTRNYGIVDCASEPSTNMFLMSGDGKYMRQVGYDQVNTFYPVLLEDGEVLYTRWEYNDRDLTNAMGLFTMYPDGSHQTEYFGNQTSWPFTQIHARPVPGSKGSKVMCVAGGHHGPYSGELMLIDRNKGTNGKASITMIAPKRETKPDVSKTDISMGNVNFLFQNPLPLDENNFIVSWRKSESETNYKLYFMNIDGSRELLASASQSVSQPVLVKAWDKIPSKIMVQANYKDSVGSFTMQDVSVGEGMKGVAKGVAKKLRVVAISYRAAGGNTGMASGQGPSGSFTPAITCPIATYGCSFEAKTVLGEANIYPDGSAAFTVPARTPVYFQVLDSMGYCIATMRSWSTLMPGEKFACVGCHEDKITTPPPSGAGQAGTPKPLEKTLGIEDKPFDYKQMVQPVFDDLKCSGCHTASHTSGFDLSGTLSGSTANKKWTTSYSSLTKGIGAKSSNNAINIFTIFVQPEQQKPYTFGSSLSGIMTKGGMSGSHHDMKPTAAQKKIVACWIDLMAPHAGKYNSYLSSADSASYQAKLDKRLKWAAVEKTNITAYMAAVGVMPNNRGSVTSAGLVADQLRIGYVPTSRSIILKKSSLGNLKVLDLKGRVIFNRKLSNLAKGDATISLPTSLGRGLYLVKFEGVNETRQAKIFITQ
jgi:hypothetical protein